MDLKQFLIKRIEGNFCDKYIVHLRRIKHLLNNRVYGVYFFEESNLVIYYYSNIHFFL